jgi:hypothetical protein
MRPLPMMPVALKSYRASHDIFGRLAQSERRQRGLAIRPRRLPLETRGGWR